MRHSEHERDIEIAVEKKKKKKTRERKRKRNREKRAAKRHSPREPSTCIVLGTAGTGPQDRPHSLQGPAQTGASTWRLRQRLLDGTFPIGLDDVDLVSWWSSLRGCGSSSGNQRPALSHSTTRFEGVFAFQMSTGTLVAGFVLAAGQRRTARDLPASAEETRESRLLIQGSLRMRYRGHAKLRRLRTDAV